MFAAPAKVVSDISISEAAHSRHKRIISDAHGQEEEDGDQADGGSDGGDQENADS